MSHRQGVEDLKEREGDTFLLFLEKYFTRFFRNVF